MDGQRLAVLHHIDGQWIAYNEHTDTLSAAHPDRSDALAAILTAEGLDPEHEVAGEVTQPGIYEMPDDDYHADPVLAAESLSQTSAKWLLPPNAPAIYRYRRDNPPETTALFDFGKAVHRLILDAGPEIVHVDADNWLTKAAKDARKDARDAGQIPLNNPEMAQALAMRDTFAAHPIAPLLFRNGQPEMSLFTIDPAHGVWLRGRVDYLGPVRDGRLILADYKTAQTAAPGKFGKSAADYGYHMQAAWYRRLARALGIAEDVRFLFVVQSKEPPYLVSIIELDADDIDRGDHLNRQAIATFAACQQSGQWPGYPAEVHRVSLPGWYRAQTDDYLDSAEEMDTPA